MHDVHPLNTWLIWWKSPLFCFIHSFIHSFIHVSICNIHSFIHLFLPSFLPSFPHSFIYVSICNIHSFIHLFVPSFLPFLIHSFMYQFVIFIRSFIYSFLPSFLPFLILSCMYQFVIFIRSFIYPFIQSFIHSFVHLLVYFIFHCSFMQLCVRSFVSFLHLCLNNWKLCNTTIKLDNMLVCIAIMPIKFVSTCEFSPIKTSSSKQSDSSISSKLRSYIWSFHINRYQRDEYTVLFCVTC